MTVTVAIPYWRCPELVERAVRSVLAQTHRDLVCVVIGDGEDPPLAGIRDSRLEVYRLPQNRGAYFAEQLVVSATPHAWYAQHAADDYSEPEHLEQLVAFGADVAVGAVCYHNGDAPPRVLRKVYEVGLYRVARLRSFGGFNPAERMGQDSLLIHLLRETGPLAVSMQPTYHRVQRAGSLSTHPSTKRGSPARNQMRARNRAIVAKCRRLRNVAAIRAYRQSLVPARIAEELAEHSDRLRGLLA